MGFTQTTIANAIWLATAQLHQENTNASDFSVREIIERAIRDNLVDGFRPGLQVHVSKHCVANKSPNPGDHRMLYETTRGRRRLFKNGDPFHPDRRNGKIRPERQELPSEYHALTDWYDAVYSKQSRFSFRSAATTADFRPPAENPGRPSTVSASVDSLGTAFVSSAGAFVIPDSLRKELRIEAGTRLSIFREDNHLVVQPVTDEFIHSLRGCCKGEGSMIEDREREHKIEKDRIAHE
jgi:bifunctional DNA-binding transcriptional regulator/antitoxin component of YhaV-PrlF toxin-antitoxin module